MITPFWKTLTAALLAAVQVFAGVMTVTAGGISAVAPASAQAVAAPCDMSCCRVQSNCWCEAAPVQAPAKPVPAVPLVQPLEFKLAAPLPVEDMLTLTLNLLEPERKAPAPSTEVVVHAPEAPLFALHCSWLI